MTLVLAPIEGTPYIGGTRPGFLSVDAQGQQRLVKHNTAAVAPPTALDDSTQGYAISSRWIYAGKEYVCTDATPLAAVWIETTAATASSGPAGAIQYAGDDGAFAGSAKATLDEDGNLTLGEFLKSSVATDTRLQFRSDNAIMLMNAAGSAWRDLSLGRVLGYASGSWLSGNTGFGGETNPQSPIHITQNADNTAPTLIQLSNGGQGAATGATIAFPWGSLVGRYGGMTLNGLVDSLSMNGTMLSYSGSGLTFTADHDLAISSGATQGKKFTLQSPGSFHFNTYYAGEFADRVVFSQAGHAGFGGNASPGFPVDVTGKIRALSAVPVNPDPYGGKGIELSFDSANDLAWIVARDYTNAVYKPILHDASLHYFYINGGATKPLTLTSSGAGFGGQANPQYPVDVTGAMQAHSPVTDIILHGDSPLYGPTIKNTTTTPGAGWTRGYNFQTQDGTICGSVGMFHTGTVPSYFYIASSPLNWA